MARKKAIEFEYEGKKFALVMPTQQDALDMDLAYRRAFSHAVREGLMPEFEAKKIFSKTGVWTKTQEEEIQQLQMKIVGMELDLDKIDSAGIKGRVLSFEIIEVRNQLLELVNHKNSLFARQTAEGYGDAIRIATLAQLCTVDENGERIFVTYETYTSWPDDTFAALCYSKAMILTSGLDEKDFDYKASERKWLEEHGYISEDGVLQKKYYEEVLSVEGEKVKPKKRAKKKAKKKKRKVKT